MSGGRPEASPRVGLFDHPLFLEHETGPGHPERPERLLAFARGLREAGLSDRLIARQAAEADAAAILRVHSDALLRDLEASRGQRVAFDPDTPAGPRSFEAALLAAGAVTGAVDALLDGDLDRALVAVRPPGHHAERDRPMGFCLLGNVAIGAAHALARGLSRVAVIDWDVHHGNGTQHAFEHDPRVLFTSSHAWPFYPGTGALAEMGEGRGRGYTINLPLPQGCGDADYVALYDGLVAPVVAAFEPELVLVSMGFDPHADDPLAGMQVTADGFGRLASACLAAAAPAGGKAVFVLEGGYDLEGIASSAAAVARVALGDPAPPAPAAPEPRFQALLGALRSAHSGHWPVLR